MEQGRIFTEISVQYASAASAEWQWLVLKNNKKKKCDLHLSTVT